MGEEFKKIIVDLCEDEGIARLSMKILNLKLSHPRETTDREIRRVIAQYAAEL